MLVVLAELPFITQFRTAICSLNPVKRTTQAEPVIVNSRLSTETYFDALNCQTCPLEAVSSASALFDGSDLKVIVFVLDAPEMAPITFDPEYVPSLNQKVTGPHTPIDPRSLKAAAIVV